MSLQRRTLPKPETLLSCATGLFGCGQVRRSAFPQGRLDRAHNRSRRPAAAQGMVIAASVCGTIEALTRALAIELVPIRVNAVSPGVVRTNLWQNMSAPERERLYEIVCNSLPVGRVGEASGMPQAYRFLLQEGFA